MTTDVDILVVGAGPAGMAAATAAAACGQKVVVLDDNASAGGQIWRSEIGNRGAAKDRRKIEVTEGFRRSGAQLLPGRRVVDAPAAKVLRVVVEQDNRTESFAWKRLILATGARERFLPFPGWTLPGVFGAGGLQALVKSGFSATGKRVVVAGTGPLLLAVAAYLKKSGVEVVSHIEQAGLAQLAGFALSLANQPAKWRQAIGYRMALAKVPYRTGCWIASVSESGQGDALSVQITDGRKTWEEACDLVACGFHLVPNTEAASLLGCRVSEGRVEVDERQQTTIEDIFCAGEATGITGLDGAMMEGEIAGLAAAGEFGRAAKLCQRSDRERRFGERMARAFALRPELRLLCSPDTIVCRCEDVTFSRLQGRTSWTDAKLQTRCGMGACQGRVCGGAVETLFGWEAGSVRPPVFPAPVASFCEDLPAADETSV